jgi:hypothetical protein
VGRIRENSQAGLENLLGERLGQRERHNPVLSSPKNQGGVANEPMLKWKKLMTGKTQNPVDRIISLVTM